MKRYRCPGCDEKCEMRWVSLPSGCVAEDGDFKGPWEEVKE